MKKEQSPLNDRFLKRMLFCRVKNMYVRAVCEFVLCYSVSLKKCN
jgi:hypothetical protein